MKTLINIFRIHFLCFLSLSLLASNPEKIAEVFKERWDIEGKQIDVQEIPGGLTNENYIYQPMSQPLKV